MEARGPYDRSPVRSRRPNDRPIMPRKWHRLAQRQEAATERGAFQPLLSLSLSLPLSLLLSRPFSTAAQRASTSRSRATDDTSESSLYMVGPSPSGRRPVNGRDSLFTADGISGRRTNVCMYVCMYGRPGGRRGSRGEEPRKRYDTIAAEDLRPVAQVRISVTRQPNRSIVSLKIYSFARNILARSIFGYDGYW